MVLSFVEADNSPRKVVHVMQNGAAQMTQDKGNYGDEDRLAVGLMAHDATLSMPDETGDIRSEGLRRSFGSMPSSKSAETYDVIPPNGICQPYAARGWPRTGMTYGTG